MLTVQAYQQHRLVVCIPTTRNRFPRQPCLRQQSLDTAAESVGPAVRRVESPVGHMSVSKRVGYGGVEAWWECCTHHVGRTKADLGRNLELSEKRRALARKKRQRKQAMRKAARMKHQAARARSRMQELTFGRSTCVQQPLKTSTASATSTYS